MPDTEVRVIAPVPWFPPVRAFRRWYIYSQYPTAETYGGVTVVRPRYPLPPKLGGYVHSDLVYPAICKAAHRLCTSGFAFDVIDAHFVFPCGVAAVRLGKKMDVPTVITGRGEDMLRFPSMAFKRSRIRWALGKADAAVALSSDIATAMIENGAEPARVVKIANGVDISQFRPLDRVQCRRELGLDDTPVILSVGDRQERKGFHLLVEAMPSVLRAHPRARLVIVGGPGRHGRDYTRKIEETIHRLGLTGHVHLAGPQPQASLPTWYNAADVFVLLSSREGSPNVLLEALACGTPAIGTPLSGIRDELADDRMGWIVPERTAEAAAEAITGALARSWDRDYIRSVMENRSWESVAASARAVLTRAIQTHERRRTPMLLAR